MTSNVRLWQGDSIQLASKLPDGSVNCIIADPPYGVDFVSYRATTPRGKAFNTKVQNDQSLDGAITLFRQVMDALLTDKCADTAELYIFTRWDIVDTWIQEAKYLSAYDFEYKMLLVWDKGIPGMGDIDSNWGCGHELILYCKRGRREVPYRRSGIIAVDKVHPSHLIHPMEKPVALIEKLLEMSTDPGDLVVDPFAGSGSTLVACQRQGRNAVGMELDPMYVERTKNRLSQPVMF